MMRLTRFFKDLSGHLKARALLSVMLATVAVGLAGCITLLPEVKAVQLYTLRFNPQLMAKVAEGSPAPQTAPVDILLNYDGFPRAAAGDRILTTEGNEVSYIDGGRWASSAQGQFRDILNEGFAREGKSVRVAAQGRVASEYRLDVEVRRFEAVYTRKKPTITVAMDARLIRVADRTVVAERYIVSDVAVRKSDLSLIVEGFEKASTEATVSLIRFVEEAAATAAKPAPEAITN